MEKEKKCECGDCDGKAEFFHSKCCGAHFEGVISPEGRLAIACEKCGKFVAYLEAGEIKKGE